VRISLKEPDGALPSIDYPYAVALLKGLEPRGKEFVFIDQDGRELDWPVQRLGAGGD
jgi:hypothetical protein